MTTLPYLFIYLKPRMLQEQGVKQTPFQLQKIINKIQLFSFFTYLFIYLLASPPIIGAIKLNYFKIIIIKLVLLHKNSLNNLNKNKERKKNR